MAFFDKLFGTKKSFAALEPDNPIFEYIEEIKQPLESLAKETKDRLEVVPADKAAYVFIGKPPKMFGLAWVQDGKVYNLKTVAKDRKLSPAKIQQVSENLREAYKRSQDDTRYSAPLGDQELVIASSDKLNQEVTRIMEKIT
ncbi:MAG: hypothetical protein P8X96_19365 [Desulfobacteraceae bacterium]